MALNFFKQRDIEDMNPNDIPEEFSNYFESLSEDRKAEIIASRPELAKGLNYFADHSEKDRDESITVNNLNKNEDDTDENIFYGVESVAAEDDSDDEDAEWLAQISENRYEGEDLDALFVDGLEPVEALTIPDEIEKCPAHRQKFEKIQIKYGPRQGSKYSVIFYLCRECKRLFVKESKVNRIHDHLTKRGIDHTFYDVSLSEQYLRKQQLPYMLSADEKVYVPDLWFEENLKCPIHNELLWELSCEKEYLGRKVSFSGCYCDQCQKIIIRKAAAVDLVDQCAMNGVPEIEYEPLIKAKPDKKIYKVNEIRPDYYIQDGKREPYNYDHFADCIALYESDTVVVSDSVYCSHEGHDTEEVLVRIKVDEKLSKCRKSYIIAAGYCSQCRKYYMDEWDYNTIYSIGRPEVTILIDLERDSYRITSGEVFNIERSHLESLEDCIFGEIASIKNQSDYVNKYAVGDYDDGNLAFAKNISMDKYDDRLDVLDRYQSKPYEYRVDISCENENETYYIGPSDIDMDGERKVISFHSEFGHDLVNYKTIKIKKNGKQYDIKLSRWFDIDRAKLFAYENLRTDEDMIFRSGITDPFLVRVLNMRKKQHNLIDIIATIQDNQNKIVDADFESNLIVQGCAGSGKTMVLLHRLSSLQYKHRKR